MEDNQFLAALRHGQITAPCVFDGAINGERFLAWVRQGRGEALLERRSMRPRCRLLRYVFFVKPKYRRDLRLKVQPYPKPPPEE